MRKIQEHGDWQIGVTTRQGPDGGWSALVEAFPPGKGPRTHTGTIVPFSSERFATAEEAEGMAFRRAREWIGQQGRGL